jgi:hypothetical protein
MMSTHRQVIYVCRSVGWYSNAQVFLVQ